MLKIIKTTLCILVISISGAFAQQKSKKSPVSNKKIIGVWQVNQVQTADAWLSHYRFYSDGKFKYSLNQYDDRGRIKDILGTYKLKGDTLTLIVNSRNELVGGDITEGSMGFQKEELVLDGGKMVSVPQKDKTPLVFAVRFSTKKNVKTFSIQNNVYYQVSTDATFQDN